MNNKLPIGLTPKKLHDENRFCDVRYAINRYYNSYHKIPIEWIEEYNKYVSKNDNIKDRLDIKEKITDSNELYGIIIEGNNIGSVVEIMGWDDEYYNILNNKWGKILKSIIKIITKEEFEIVKNRYKERDILELEDQIASIRELQYKLISFKIENLESAKLSTKIDELIKIVKEDYNL